MAVDSMRKAYARDEVREMIEAREKAERDEISRLHHARQEGRLEGLRTAALGMRAAGMSLDQMTAALGVSLEQLHDWISES